MSTPSFDPTALIDLDFAAYIASRKAHFAERSHGGVPDYAFNLDHAIRRKLNAIPLLRRTGELLTSYVVPIQRQLHQMDAVAVGPRQFREVHEMGVECARILGIGIPQIFVIMNPMPNAFTYATGQTDQIVVLTSGLVEALSMPQLRSVIGHECGHIHNEHVVYNTIWEMITNPLANMLLRAASGTLGPFAPLVTMLTKGTLFLVFQRWHRCAEFTCDRAGLVCSADLGASIEVMGRLDTAGAENLQGFDADEYVRQLDGIEGSPIRFLELLHTHPIGPRRVKAMRLFGESEVLYRWRPEMKHGQATRPHVDVDRDCAALLV
ncbi:MAG: M48 family metallopeptidase [Pseudomonadota bacterium]